MNEHLPIAVARLWPVLVGMFRLGKLLSNQLGVRMLPARGLELGSHSARAERLQLRGNFTKYVRKPNEILRFALDDRLE